MWIIAELRKPKSRAGLAEAVNVLIVVYGAEVGCLGCCGSLGSVNNMS